MRNTSKRVVCVMLKSLSTPCRIWQNKRDHTKCVLSFI